MIEVKKHGILLSKTDLEFENEGFLQVQYANSEIPDKKEFEVL